MEASTKKTRKRWTFEEDEVLFLLVKEFGLGDPERWSKFSKMMHEEGYDRDRRQIQQRWSNVLDPMIERGIWSTEEDDRLLELATQTLSATKKWKMIAGHFIGRTSNDVKNRFHVLNKRRIVSEQPLCSSKSRMGVYKNYS